MTMLKHALLATAILLKSLNFCLTLTNTKCSNGFFPCDNTCYFVSNKTLSWNDAKFECMQLQEHNSLITLDEKWKDTNVRRCLQNLRIEQDEIWIGGIFDAQQQQWIWGVTGKAVQYQAFSRKTVDDDVNWNCIVLNGKLRYRWTARSCMLEKYYMCEIL